MSKNHFINRFGKKSPKEWAKQERCSDDESENDDWNRMMNDDCTDRTFRKEVKNENDVCRCHNVENCGMRRHKHEKICPPNFDIDNCAQWLQVMQNLFDQEKIFDDQSKVIRVVNSLPNDLRQKILLSLSDTDGTYEALTTLIINSSNINTEKRIKRGFERKFTNEKPSDILETLRHDLSFNCDAELSNNEYEILRTLFHQKIPNRSIIPLLVSSVNDGDLCNEAKRADAINEIMINQNFEAESTNCVTKLPYAITAPNAKCNLQASKSSKSAVTGSIQTQSNDVNTMSILTTLLYDIRDSLSKQSENATKLNEHNIRMSEQLMKQINNVSNNTELTTTLRTDSAQGTSQNTAKVPSDNADWRARDYSEYNNRPQNEANICYAHYYYGRRAKFCQPWCRYQDEFNNLSQTSQVSNNSKNA